MSIKAGVYELRLNIVLFSTKTVFNTDEDFIEISIKNTDAKTLILLEKILLNSENNMNRWIQRKFNFELINEDITKITVCQFLFYS